MALALLSQRKMRRFSNKIFAASEASLRFYDLIEFLEQKWKLRKSPKIDDFWRENSNISN